MRAALALALGIAGVLQKQTTVHSEDNVVDRVLLLHVHMIQTVKHVMNSRQTRRPWLMQLVAVLLNKDWKSVGSGFLFEMNL